MRSNSSINTRRADDAEAHTGRLLLARGKLVALALRSAAMASTPLSESPQ
jgi:hypothetical protein